MSVRQAASGGRLAEGQRDRARNLAVALVLGSIAVAVVLSLSSRSSGPAETPTDTATVLVVTRDVAVGTSGIDLLRKGLVATRHVGRDVAVPGALSSRAALRGLVVVEPTFAGDQLSTRRLAGADERGVASALHGPMRVVELAGDRHQLLAGTLVAGNRVDVVASVPVGQSGQAHVGVVVLRDLLVVEAPDAPSRSASSDDELGVQLRLTGDQAQRLIWIEKNADWMLAVRPPLGATDPVAEPVSAAAVVAGGRVG